MTGAIEFMKAWRDLCEQRRCEDCTLFEICMEYGREYSDEQITELVRQVMEESREVDENDGRN